ncbi:hypothetical protein EZV62_013106 [Acer yangbiense]|uniref:Pectinesterase n=1 Tax=Acer yangbiense TaxID=1000413 RepID=A0A5C7HX85_9ROSI|nr:hypothetical protein EZV62_013106 [Acer yangbiense]
MQILSRLGFLFFLVTLLSFSIPTFANSSTDYLQNECLKVPTSSFLSSLTTTIDAIRQTVPVVSGFTNMFEDFRLKNAINDCLDLLDFSADELSWSASASQNPNGNSSGDLSSDLRSWLSAALANQETCIDGFDGTNGIVKSVVAGSLDQINSLVQELLTMVQPTSNSTESSIRSGSGNGGGSGGGGNGGKSGKKFTNKGQFPAWFKRDDRKLLMVDGVPADVVVAADGTGNFTNIMDAVLASPDYSMTRHVIYIKRGLYKEYVEIEKKKWNLVMVGDGMNATIISGDRNHADGWPTFRSATFAVNGRGFIAREITFENTAGPVKEQAVALRSNSDLSVFYRCEIRGYQDSLYPHSLRQFYRECKISGTIDFIFGFATAVFQKCHILARRGLPNQKNTITANGRLELNNTAGFSIQFCNISADSDLLSSINTTSSYLGRPWKLYSRTIIMQSYISDAIRPEGWLEWNTSGFALDTLYYGEYMNFGPGADLSRRVKWPGYQASLNDSVADSYTVANFILGDLWLPSTGVEYTAGLAV